jgi:excisionase family DNA binding protein
LELALSNPTDNSDLAVRAKLSEQRRARADRLKADRKAAIRTGEAIYVTPREAAVLTGLTLETIYRRVANGTLKAKKLGKGQRGGRLLIGRSQL